MNRSELDHLPLFDVPYLFKASSDKDYRARILIRAHATAEILTECGLSKENLTKKYEKSPETFVVSLGELTDEGLEFARSPYQNWLANSDRWSGEFTLEKCKNTLRKQWQKFKTRKPP